MTDPTFPAGCPITCAGMSAATLTLIFQTQMGEVRIPADRLCRNQLLALMGSTLWLEHNFPRETPDGTLDFDPRRAAEALILECHRAELRRWGLKP